MKAVGGEIGSASALAPKLGPLGLVRLVTITFIYKIEQLSFCINAYFEHLLKHSHPKK